LESPLTLAGHSIRDQSSAGVLTPCTCRSGLRYVGPKWTEAKTLERHAVGISGGDWEGAVNAVYVYPKSTD